jgi:hypothetical protein
MHEKGKKHRKPDRRMKMTVFQAPKGNQDGRARPASWQGNGGRQAVEGM